MQLCRNFLLATSLGLSLALFGCSGNPKTYPTSGTVKFADGHPLARGWVEFRPVDGETTHSARGLIADDGSFQLTTFAATDGALPGKHRVLIVPPEPTGAVELGENRAFPEVIHRRFRGFETSGLEFTITENAASNHFDIIVQQPGK